MKLSKTAVALSSALSVASCGATPPKITLEAPWGLGKIEVSADPSTSLKDAEERARQELMGKFGIKIGDVVCGKSAPAPIGIPYISVKIDGTPESVVCQPKEAQKNETIPGNNFPVPSTITINGDVVLGVKVVSGNAEDDSPATGGATDEKPPEETEPAVVEEDTADIESEPVYVEPEPPAPVPEPTPEPKAERIPNNKPFVHPLADDLEREVTALTKKAAQLNKIQYRTEPEEAALAETTRELATAKQRLAKARDYTLRRDPIPAFKIPKGKNMNWVIVSDACDEALREVMEDAVVANRELDRATLPRELNMKLDEDSGWRPPSPDVLSPYRDVSQWQRYQYYNSALNPAWAFYADLDLPRGDGEFAKYLAANPDMIREGNFLYRSHSERNSWIDQVTVLERSGLARNEIDSVYPRGIDRDRFIIDPRVIQAQAEADVKTCVQQLDHANAVVTLLGRIKERLDNATKRAAQLRKTDELRKRKAHQEERTRTRQGASELADQYR